MEKKERNRDRTKMKESEKRGMGIKVNWVDG